MRTRPLLALAVVTAACLSPDRAEAIPAFAREHNIPCSTCHVAVPYLTHVGRRFKEAGYRLPDADGSIDPEMQPSRRFSDALLLDPNFPIAARLRGDLVSKERGEDERIQPLNEAILMALGSWSDQGSFFFQLSATSAGAWTPTTAVQLGFHPSRYANVEVGNTGPFHADPYNTFGHPITVFAKTTPMRLMDHHATPTILLYGRAADLYYGVSLNSGPDNPEGVRPRTATVRLAYDVGDDLMVGAFGVYGDLGEADEAAGTTEAGHALTVGRGRLGVLRQAAEAHDEAAAVMGAGASGSHEMGHAEAPEKIARGGVDCNVALGPVNAVAMFALIRDEGHEGTTNDLSAFAELLYPWQSDGRPVIVPLLRLEYDTFADRDDKLVGLVAGVNHYVRENARLAIEGRADLKAREGAERGWTGALTLDVAF